MLFSLRRRRRCSSFNGPMRGERPFEVHGFHHRLSAAEDAAAEEHPKKNPQTFLDAVKMQNKTFVFVGRTGKVCNKKQDFYFI